MSFAQVSHGAIGGASDATVTINTTGANLLVSAFGWYAGSLADPISVNDNKSNTYSASSKYTTGTPVSIRMYWSTDTVPTVGSGHDFLVHGSSQFIGLGFTAWSGATAGTGVRDQESGKTETSTNTITLPSLTPSEDNCLVVTAVTFEDNSSGAVSITGGWTILNTVAWNGSTNEGFSIAYQIQTSAAACAPQWNVTNTAGSLAAVMAVFKGPGGGGGSPSGFGPLLAGQRNRMILGG